MCWLKMMWNVQKSDLEKNSVWMCVCVFVLKPRKIQAWWKNGIRIIHGDTLVIHGGTWKITVCSSTFNGVNSYFYCVGSKNYCSRRKMYWNIP